ncbi:MAG TPA: flagellar basal body P-ring formation protein FlgA [bacterium]|nr:flagellar basal body P-ring formation protein FlgA [bacterium]
MKILALMTLGAALFGGGDGDPPKKPELRMKAAVTVRGLHVTIGDLCEITPSNAETLAIAQVRFGPAPLSGYAREVSRTDVMQALAAAGVQLKTVDLTGGQRVQVQGLAVEVPQQDILDAAITSLQAQLALEGGDVEFDPPTRLRRYKAPPGRVSQDLRARVRQSRTHLSRAIVDVEILVDGETFKKVPVTFRLRRYHKVLKTTGSIRRGTTLGPENCRLVREQLTQTNSLFLQRLDQVAGMNAAKDLRPNQVLMLGDIEPPAAIHRGDVVTVVLRRGRVRVTTRAIANHDAPLEGRIQLTNMNSKSQMTGVVQGPGLVVIN